MTVITLAPAPARASTGATIAERAAWSARVFTTMVWPQVGRYLFPQHRGLTPAEGAPGPAADALDRVGGIDYLVDTGVGLLPMSTRVQPDRGYRTVTASAGQVARLNGPAWAAAPALYLHAYVDPASEQPVAVLWVWAPDLVTALASAPAVHGPDGTAFWAVGTAAPGVHLLGCNPLGLPAGT